MLAADGVNVNVSAISEPAGEPPASPDLPTSVPAALAGGPCAREQSLFRLNYHQQYLHKVPNGYCGLAGTGVSCPVGVVRAHSES
jgi:hypothetical protein